MNHHSFDRSDFDNGAIDEGALHLEMVSTFGANFTHVERWDDEVRVYFVDLPAIEDVRVVVVAHRSSAIPFDPYGE